MVRFNLSLLLGLLAWISTWRCTSQGCLKVRPKVQPQMVLLEGYERPFIAHIRFNVTEPQRLFVETSLKNQTQSISGDIMDEMFVLSIGSVQATIPISYHKVYTVTFAVNPTFVSDINVKPSDVIRSRSTLTVNSPELLVFWYKHVFL